MASWQAPPPQIWMGSREGQTAVTLPDQVETNPWRQRAEGAESGNDCIDKIRGGGGTVGAELRRGQAGVKERLCMGACMLKE